MRGRLLFMSIIIVLLSSCDKSSLIPGGLQGPSEWTTAKVAVVLPLSGPDNDKERYDRISKMFEENVIKAHLGSPVGVKLELEWFDENTLDINKFANDLYYRDDVVALVGPLRDANVNAVAKVIYKKGIPMFVMTSSEEILRRYSSGTAGVTVKDPFMWSLSDSDMLQARIILVKAGTIGIDKISLICSNNEYGTTFDKWVPHYAGEMDLNIVDKVRYSDAQGLKSGFARVCESDAGAVICALSNPDDAKIVLEMAKNYPGAPKIYFTGSVLNSPFLKLGAVAEGAEGFSMYPTPFTGFQMAYQTRFGEMPMNIEAQLYDSFLLALISFACQHYSGNGISMNKALAQLSDLPLVRDDDDKLNQFLYWETGTPVWDYAALGEMILEPLREGKFPEVNPVGAIGSLKFAPESYTYLAKSSYINWVVTNGTPHALDYIDEDGIKYSSYIFAWDWYKMLEDLEDDSDSKYTPSLQDGNKAVLICGSEGWYNYRHQADILYVYNTLKKNRYTDDDIILIMRDDIAYHPKNPHQGVIKVSPDGENLYQDVVLDYRADTLTTKDIEDILQGNKSGRLSTVLESTDTDNVLLYWTGHGAEKSFSWLEKGEKFTDQQLGATVRKLYDDKKYKSMLICAEPCYSGSVVSAIEGVPLVLGFSAASDSESSYADNFSSELGVWMCDRFSFNLVRIYEEFKYVSLLDTYKKLNQSTLASHVQVFNAENFYNLGDEMLWSYFYNFGNY